MMLYRYKVSLGYKTTGIFHVLNELEKAMEENATIEEQQELEDAEYILNRDLPCIPDFGISTRTWFTEEGNARFHEEIQVLVYYINLYLGRLVIRREMSKHWSEQMYEDEYQVVY